jgi:hypothetical protein
VGHYLAPWLAREAGLNAVPPRDGIGVQTELPTGRDERPLAPLGPVVSR